MSVSNANREITIRMTTAVDAHLLAEVAAASFVEGFGHLYKPENLAAFLQESRSQKRYAELLQNPDIRIWLALDASGVAVGYAIAGNCKLPIENLETSAGEIYELYVRAAYQKHRIGTQ